MKLKFPFRQSAVQQIIGREADNATFRREVIADLFVSRPHLFNY